MTNEIILMWATVTLYAIGAVLYVIGAVFGRDRLDKVALVASLVGVVPHVAAIAIRWVRVGHGPYLGFYEVVSSFALFAVLGLALLAWRMPGLKRLGTVIMPLAFLLIGGAMLAPTSDLEITGTLASWWLTLHVTFAKLAAGSFITAFALAVAYLVRDRGGEGRFARWFEKLPGQEVVDDLVFRFVGVGFVFLSIMIVAGAIWANEAWNRYWAWDPIETWSLIWWLTYAVYLHLRLTLGWRGRKSAWYAVAALPVALFALVGVAIVYNSIHGAYLTGY